MNSLLGKMTKATKVSKKKKVATIASVYHRDYELTLNPPSIKFEKSKMISEIDDEGNYKKVELRISRDDPNSKTVEKKVKLFGDSDESPEAWVKWCMELQEVIRDFPLTDGNQKIAMAIALLKGRAREKVQHTHIRLLAENDKSNLQKDSDTLFNDTISEVGQSYFPILHAYRKQVYYMKRYLRIGNNTVREFAARLRELNNYLPYFPKENGKPPPESLSDDELIEILNQAKPEEWQAAILGANIEVFDFNFQQTIDYFEKLEVKQKLEKVSRKEKSFLTKNSDKSEQFVQNKQKNANKVCRYCKRTNHASEECWYKNNTNYASKSRPKPNGTGTGTSKTSNNKLGKPITFTQEQFNAICSSLPWDKISGKTQESKKRKLSDSDEDTSTEQLHTYDWSPYSTTSSVEGKHSSDNKYIYLDLLSIDKLSNKLSHLHKKQKQQHRTTEIVGEVLGGKDLSLLRILLDTGASSTIILRDAIPIGIGHKRDAQVTHWHTMGGHFVTQCRREITFRLPEFSSSKTITWCCHEDKVTKRVKSQYDMVIGIDLMTELGIDINFSTSRISWEGTEIPMKLKNQVSDLNVAMDIYHFNMEATVIKEAEERHQRILDADYRAIDLKEYTDKLTHLTLQERIELLELLRQFPRLFSGGLGTLKVPPVKLELRPLEPHEKPYHA